jgi:hypothetical protein
MCNSCRLSKVGKMTGKKINLRTGATIAAGTFASAIAAQQIQKAIPAASGTYGAAAIQVGLGLLTPTLIKGETGKNLATGMVVGGILSVFAGLTSMSRTAGLLKSTGSTYLPNVSGVGAYNATSVTNEKVKMKMN